MPVLRSSGLRRARRLALHTASAVAATAAAALAPLSPGAAVQAAALFQALDLDQQRFVLVAAPIGDGSKAQLNIYEQLNGTRPCFAVSAGQPASVDPLLATFNFTGICSRFIDANGYSVRVGGTDLATTYRLSVIRGQDDNVLMAIPTKDGAGPEMVVARTQGAGSGFLQLQLEPGWRLMRRGYGGRALGHVYLYRDGWPSDTAAVDQLPAAPLARSEQPGG